MQEYGLHRANVATREFALCMGGYCLEIKQRQMFEGTSFFRYTQTKSQKAEEYFQFSQFFGRRFFFFNKNPKKGGHPP